MRNNFFLTPGYATDLVNVIIKGFSEKTYVCPHDWQQLYTFKERVGIKIRREGHKWFVLLRGGDNYGGEFETQVIEDNSVLCSKPRFEGPYQKLGFLKYEGQSAKGTFLEDGYILNEEGQYIVYE
jgi:hypothetical protein